jgi:hypothetical protein
MLLDQQITADQLQKLAEGVALGEYNLLLGAGASRGGFGGGSPLPVGDELPAELVREFSIPSEGMQLSLLDAYEEAELRTSTKGETLAQYFKERFTGCVPPAWLSKLPTFSWKRIWTLNIDDTLETAYGDNDAPRQRLLPVSWFEPFSDLDPGQLQVVHLHGRATDSKRLVFSIVEYFGTTTGLHAWHRVFADLYQETPFVVIGATLRGEFDLAPVIRRGSTSGTMLGKPSFFVSPNLTALQRDFATRHGLVPISLTAEEFLTELTPYIRTAERDIRQVTGTTGTGVPVQAQSFLEQYMPLRVQTVRRTKLRDFYLGYDPTWSDILLEKDAEFSVVDTVVKSVLALQQLSKPTQRLEVLHGPWGTGKSTALLRIARRLIASGLEVHMFRDDSTIDVDATNWWLQRRPKSILLFDGVADFAPEIEKLFQLGKKQRRTIHIVGVERQHRMRKLEGSLSSEFVAAAGDRFMQRLSDEDIKRLIKTLDDNSRLGKITRWTPQRRFLYFAKDSWRQLFTAMSELEGGPGFGERLNAEFSQHRLSGSLSDTLALCAFAYEFGYALPIGVLTHATGMRADELIESCENGSLSEWTDIVHGGIRLRHRRIADIIVTNVLNPQERYRLSQQLARSLSPRVTRDSISSRSVAYRIVRNLMDASSVRRWVGSAAIRWYAELFNEYSWNARYWEQRSLTHLKAGDNSSARSYAERAVSIHRDPFTQTTLAHIILQQVAEAVDGGRELNLDEYQEAVQLLVTARDTSHQHDEYPYTVFFESSIRIARTLVGRNEDWSALQSQIRDWLSDAEQSDLARYPDYRRLIERVRRGFAKLARGPE